MRMTKRKREKAKEEENGIAERNVSIYHILQLHILAANEMG